MTGSNDIGVINPHSNYIFKLHFDFDWDLLAPFCHELISTTPKGLSLVTNGHTSHQNKKQPHTEGKDCNNETEQFVKILTGSSIHQLQGKLKNLTIRP